MRRKLIQFSLLLTFLLCGFTLRTQAQTYGFGIQQTVGADTLFVNYVAVKTTGNVNDIFGFSNLVVNYDSTTLDLNNAVIVERGIFDQQNNPNLYQSLTLEKQAFSSALNLTINRVSVSTGSLIFPVGTPTPVARIAIPLKKCSGNTGASWRRPPQAGSGNITLYDGTIISNSEMVFNNPQGSSSGWCRLCYFF